jgi:hypothetical protein
MLHNYVVCARVLWVKVYIHCVFCVHVCGGLRVGALMRVCARVSMCVHAFVHVLCVLGVHVCVFPRPRVGFFPPEASFESRLNLDASRTELYAGLCPLAVLPHCSELTASRPGQVVSWQQQRRAGKAALPGAALSSWAKLQTACVSAGEAQPPLLADSRFTVYTLAFVKAFVSLDSSF